MAQISSPGTNLCFNWYWFTAAEDLSGMPQTTPPPPPPQALLLLMFLQDERFFWMVHTYVSQYSHKMLTSKEKVTVESPDKHHLNQVIKTNLSHDGTD